MHNCYSTNTTFQVRNQEQPNVETLETMYTRFEVWCADLFWETQT